MGTCSRITSPVFHGTGAGMPQPVPHCRDTRNTDGKAVVKASGGSFSSCTADCENTHCLVTHGQGINYNET